MGSKLIWARNHNAAGRGSDPMPQIIHEEVGTAHLEIVASHSLPDGMVERLPLDTIIALYPAPKSSTT